MIDGAKKFFTEGSWLGALVLVGVLVKTGYVAAGANMPAPLKP